jgi:peptidyl-prolyl cis-trans isomerase C
LRPSSRVIVLALVLAAAACRRPSTDPVILALGDLTVRRSEFQKHLRSLEAKGLTSPDAALRQALLEPFLEERILVLEARRRGLLKAGSSQEEERAAIQTLLTDEVLSKLSVSDEEIASYYRDHPDEFRTPDTVVVRQILVPTRAEALDVRRRLARDPRSFEALAQSRSKSPEASAGGLMGSFSRGQLPAELEEVAFSLQVGTFSDVVETPLGFHVLRVDAREPERALTLDESRGRIRDELMRQRSDQATRQFLRGLLARAKVNHEAAESLVP